MAENIENEKVADKEEQMNPDNLFKEEIYTDRKIGVIRVLVPVKADGTPDASRKTTFTGEAQIMTQMGALPISFEIEAENLAEAVSKYREAAKAGVEKTMKELQELRRQAASKIVVPGQPGFTPPEGAGSSGLVMP